MIPLPRAPMLAAAMLVGVAVGILCAVLASLLVHAPVRADLVVALVLGVPTGLGVLTLLVSGRRWVTAAGAFLLSIAPGWFAVLALIQVTHGGG
ncbi:MAG: putative holin [Mycolicibacterium sp.]|uniref:Hydrophobic protein n=1 Tax=Mycolicibacterium insubricum TaxID=444597 RepID=A0A1X0DBB7_9MYCO|nr:putative holin [Mycolicibacterium insubricum]MCB0929247.1 putative holin [Mycobacterium sp.]MCB9440712.1 putative holin [Mycolicibacterium sp.]MCV7082509.1 putative holin [Mycolicibacterium insubricum]ORA69499.1 hypothetical protein BST26_13515 [Mycolicibacterium insubricum]